VVFHVVAVTRQVTQQQYITGTRQKRDEKEEYGEEGTHSARPGSA